MDKIVDNNEYLHYYIRSFIASWQRIVGHTPFGFKKTKSKTGEIYQEK
jgi:hypothetical protein